MLLSLVIAKLVKAIERLISLAVTVVDKARVLPGEMLFGMAEEVTGADEGCGTACVIASIEVSIGVGAVGGCGDAGGGCRQVGKSCGARLDVATCGVVQFECISGGWCEVVDEIVADKVIDGVKAAEVIEL